MLPAAPLWAANGQPPRPPTVVSKRATPILSAVWALATAMPRVSCRWRAMVTSGQRSRTAPTTFSMRGGTAQPMVSASEITVMVSPWSAAIWNPSSAHLRTVSTGTSPWKLQPKAAITEMRLTATPWDWCTSVCLRMAATLSAWERLRFFWENASEAASEIEPEMVSLSLKASARSRPRALNQSAV